MDTRTTIASPAPLTLGDGRPAAAAWTLDATKRHINHGSFGAVPIVAQDRQQALRREMEAAPLTWFPALPAKVGAVRAELASFLGVETEQLAIVPNASAGASVVFTSLPVTTGLEIVVTDHGYGAVTMGAERLARRWGGTVRTARIPLDADAQTAHDAVVAEFSDRTALVVMDQITSPTARLLPVQQIAATARAAGIPTLVDAAHVPGLYADPLAGLDCDFWVGNLHKFGCAPRGTAVLVARSPLAQELHPLIDSWGAPQPFPQRFDTQGTVDVTSYLAAPTSLAFIEDTWGWDGAREYMTALADYAVDIVAEAVSAFTGEDSRVDVGMPVNALRLVKLPTGLATSHATADGLRDRVSAELGFEGAFTNLGDAGYVRLSTHVYNTAQDFEDFAERAVPVLARWGAEERAAAR